MVFCGQCGSLLSPRDLTCPNCGAATEANQSAEDVSTDAPTVASSLPGYPLSTPQSQHPASPPPAPRQQKLVLPGNVPAGIEPPGIIPAEVYAPDTPILGGTAVVVLRQNGLLGNGGTPTPPTLSPTRQAQALIQQYYDDINKRDYHAAYNLWGTDPQHPTPTYDQFASGYANTQHDDISFGTITPNADGTVTVDLTILATETTSTGTVKSTYQGSYIVGQQNGAWKLLKGNFSKV